MYPEKMSEANNFCDFRDFCVTHLHFAAGEPRGTAKLLPPPPRLGKATRTQCK